MFYVMLDDLAACKAAADSSGAVSTYVLTLHPQVQEGLPLETSRIYIRTCVGKHSISNLSVDQTYIIVIT